MVSIEKVGFLNRWGRSIAVATGIGTTLAGGTALHVTSQRALEESERTTRAGLEQRLNETRSEFDLRLQSEQAIRESKITELEKAGEKKENALKAQIGEAQGKIVTLDDELKQAGKDLGDLHLKLKERQKENEELKDGLAKQEEQLRTKFTWDQFSTVAKNVLP